MNQLGLKQVFNKGRNNRRVKCKLTLPVGETAQNTRIRRDAMTGTIDYRFFKKKKEKTSKETGKAPGILGSYESSMIQIHRTMEGYKRRGLAFCAVHTPIQCAQTHTNIHYKGNTKNRKA